MRMATEKLRRDALDHVAEIKRADFFGHAGVEYDLQQKVAKLVLEVEEIAACDRIGDFVSFFDGIRSNGRKVLLQVPRTSGARRA